MLPDISRELLVPTAGNNHWWMRPLLLPPGASSGQENGGSDDGQGGESQVAGQLGNLTVFQIEALAGDVPDEPARRHQKQCNDDLGAFKKWRVLLAGVESRIIIVTASSLLLPLRAEYPAHQKTQGAAEHESACEAEMKDTARPVAPAQTLFSPQIRWLK